MGGGLSERRTTAAEIEGSRAGMDSGTEADIEGSCAGLDNGVANFVNGGLEDHRAATGEFEGSRADMDGGPENLNIIAGEIKGPFAGMDDGLDAWSGSAAEIEGSGTGMDGGIEGRSTIAAKIEGSNGGVGSDLKEFSNGAAEVLGSRTGSDGGLEESRSCGVGSSVGVNGGFDESRPASGAHMYNGCGRRRKLHGQHSDVSTAASEEGFEAGALAPSELPRPPETSSADEGSEHRSLVTTDERRAWADMDSVSEIEAERAERGSESQLNSGNLGGDEASQSLSSSISEAGQRTQLAGMSSLLTDDRILSVVAMQAGLSSWAALAAAARSLAAARNVHAEAPRPPSLGRPRATKTGMAEAHAAAQSPRRTPLCQHGPCRGSDDTRAELETLVIAALAGIGVSATSSELASSTGKQLTNMLASLRQKRGGL